MAEPELHLTPQAVSEGKRSVFVWIAVGLLFVMGAATGVFFLSSPQQSAPAPPPSQEDMAYAEQLQLWDLNLSAEENFLGQQVVYLTGKITNRGTKTVRQLRVRLFFRDYYSQVVLQEEQTVLSELSPPLAPEQARDFQLRFDRIPDSWNRQIPQFQLVSIQVQ
ncbi:MAG: hypothetical protein HY648_08765 [Acidobacteria bacterium]|nr:hypothetical protein [Acidobacteriota bacterium]